MSLVTINVGSHGQPYTVSEMRRRLAQVLAKLDGGQEISFSFVGVLENYRAPVRTVRQVEAEENRQDMDCRRWSAECDRALVRWEVEKRNHGPQC